MFDYGDKLSTIQGRNVNYLGTYYQLFGDSTTTVLGQIV